MINKLVKLITYDLPDSEHLGVMISLNVNVLHGLLENIKKSQNFPTYGKVNYECKRKLLKGDRV